MIEHPRTEPAVNVMVILFAVLVVFLLAYDIIDSCCLTFGEPKAVTVESYHNDYTQLVFGDEDICTIRFVLNTDEMYDHRSEEFCNRIKPGDKLVAVSALTRLTQKRIWKLKDPRDPH